VFIQQLTEVILPSGWNNVEICKQITIFILFQVSSELVTLLKFMHASTWVSIIIFVPEISANFTSYIVHNISIHLAWNMQPYQFNLLSFYLIILSNLCQTIFCAALTPIGWSAYILSNTFPSPPNDVHIIIQVTQSCKPVLHFNLILFCNFHIV